jgi:alpha-beta hydrolase superfamily lysophospholipase
MKLEEGAVTQRAIPGPALYFTAAFPENPKVVVGIVPGYADHAARYPHVMEVWASKGIGSVAIDVRGHGRATGPRGYCSRFDEYLDDCAELARLVDDRARNLPRFLFGHSFGGLVAAASVLEAPRQWKGLVLGSPFFGLALKVPKAKIAAGKIASRLIPRLGLPSGLKGAQMTSDPRKAKEYDEDPLIFKNATARFFTEAMATQEKCLARASSLKMPLLTLFGGADPVNDIQAARTFHERASSTDKKFKEYPGLLHELVNEPSGKEIAADIAEWILPRAT